MTKKKSWHNQFDVIGELGSGGNAKVYRVKAKNTGEELALKELYNKNKEKKQRFVDEINVTVQNYKKVDGIIPIIDSSTEEFWYTMPIADSIIEHIRIKEEGIEDIIRGVIQLTETLSKLHSKQIYHRDIKPSNIYYYKGRYYLGDFGLVDYPDNSHDFTRSNRGLGAIFTIAPEMRRDPKNANGGKADVFSLAKTMWMLLTEDERGFDGVYDFLDRSHSLRFMRKFKGVHIVELEELLTNATTNKADTRPNIDCFRQQLEIWMEVISDYKKSQASDWNFLNRYLFGDNPPESTIWRNTVKIVNVLNIVGTLPAYNHMLFSGKGGVDFSKTEFANEDGCIYVYDSCNYCLVLKPKSLHFESFSEDYVWNYFLLELDELSPINNNQSTMEYEVLVEDIPAHYVSATYSQYGVYDYDSGTPFPSGYKVVYRYLHGKILIVMKYGPYNGITTTYDGRHGMCSSYEFRGYINELIKIVKKLKSLGLDEESILNSNIIGTNPFDNKVTNKTSQKIEYDKKDPNSYVEENYRNWCFKDLFVENLDKGNIRYYITFHNGHESLSSILTGEQLYICTDGYIKNVKEQNFSDVYCVYNREEALCLKKQCTRLINDKCIQNNLDLPENYGYYFTIYLKKYGKPTHLFTKAEIKQAMRTADDRQNNTLIIDENGYAKIIQDIDSKGLYPVRHETWNAGNVLVGKYSKLLTLNDDYISTLQGWLTYLQTGKEVYMDYVYENTNEEDLLKSIKKYY